MPFTIEAVFPAVACAIESQDEKQFADADGAAACIGASDAITTCRIALVDRQNIRGARAVRAAHSRPKLVAVRNRSIPSATL